MLTDIGEAPCALEVSGLTKSFGGEKVVDGLEFRLRPGMIFSLLGPNGAGKTTTIKVLYGSLRPDSGTILYGGKDFGRFRREIKLTIGICSQNDTIDYDLTVCENLHVFGAYYHLPGKVYRRRAAELLSRFGLEKYRDNTARMLSGGLKRRLQIARALINQPRVLFLDEPTVGLDPHGRRELWDLLHQLREDGITIFLTTHYMDEAETLADHVIILDRGRVIEEGRPAEIIGRHFDGLVVQVPDTPPLRDFLREEGVPFFHGYGRLTLFNAGEIFHTLEKRHAGEETVRRRPNLEDLFVKLTGRSL